MNFRRIAALAALALCAAVTAAPDVAVAQSAGTTARQPQVPGTAKRLDWGDPAPPLTIDTWLKGEPVPQLKKGHPYIVEFWATWCGPCKVSIPHLTEMQAKFKDKGVVFVGISDEGLDKVKPFVEQMGDKMNYIVACDDERKSNAGYMEAYEQSGIPTAFVVGKDKKVLWVGHPMSDLETTLEQVIKGTYDIAAALKKEQTRAEIAEYTKLSSSGDAKAAELGKKILSNLPDDVDALVEFAFGIVANPQNKNRDFALANQALDRAGKAAGEKDSRVLGTRAIALFESGKQTEGLALAKEAVANCKDPQKLPMYQNFVRVMESRSKTKSSASPTPTPATPTPKTK
jgi:thiol-disulfide isomerase/thioredoxin